ncbi:MAG: acylglycerol kinase family protein, partial [Candidatus Acidiferrum sp.]
MELPSRETSVIPDLLLVNPVAGGGRAAAVVHELREFANRRSWNVEICVTASAEELVAQSREAVAAGRKRIFVLGGDGTFQLLMNAVSD